MDAWEPVEVPVLPSADGVRVRLHNPLTGEAVPVGPTSGEARLYACGITPYDAAHLGHAFTYVAIDLLVRAWTDAGLSVRYAQNVTDVDDPLLERATATGQDWAALAQDQIAQYRSDMRALRVLPPVQLTGVVESLDLVTEAIGRLKEHQVVYQVPDPQFPDWYFSVTSSSNLLADSPVSMVEAETLFAERGGDPDRDGKRHRLDPLVWRQERPGEPAWESWLGRGRPGWHIECTAIALDALGAAFDVQAGGSDLAFPHHSMSAAEGRVLTGETFAKASLHTGMVGYAGTKMSKSLGNLVFVSGLLADGADPMAIRLLLLDHHYRSDWEYLPGLLDVATERLTRWREAVAAPSGPDATGVLAGVRASLHNDLDAPAGLAVIDAWVETCLAEGGADSTAPALVRDLADALLGLAL
jgi:L-cysteine:1D-myo-inositol 2-amino-2-deoxy-alpha-D-glucopyranoside ligase